MKKAPAVVAVVPELRACPKCRLGMQRGRGPHGLAWHQCIPRTVLTDALQSSDVLTAERAEELLIRQLLDDVSTGKLTSVAGLQTLAALRKAGQVRGGTGAEGGSDDANETLRYLNRRKK